MTIPTTPLFRLVFLLLGLLISPAAINAASRTVDSHMDNGQPGTLRYEIGQSQDGDVITITTTATILLTGTDINIATNLTIRAQTNVQVVIDGDDSSRIFSVSHASVTLAGLTLQNGRGPAAGGGAIYLDSGVLRAENCTVANNVCYLAEGGGIYARQSRIHLFNCDFNNNDTDVLGGGIYTKNTYLFTTSCTFRHNGNSDNPNGGAIYGLLGAFEFHHTDIFGNAARTNGGGIYLYEASASLANCRFWDNDGESAGLSMYTRNVSTSTIVTMTECSASSQNVSGFHSMFDFSTSQSGLISVVVSRCEMILSTNSNAQEIISLGTLGGLGSSIKLLHSTFENPSGRTLCVDGDDNLTFIDGCVFRNNSTRGNGGAVFVEDGADNATVTIVNSSFVNNTVTGTGHSGGGGAVYTTGDNIDFTMRNCHLENNSAKYCGGAIELGNFRRALLEGCTFAGNTTSTIGGGALSIGRGGIQVTIASCTFASNRTAAVGGAIYANSTIPVTITSSTITNNSALADGGAIYVNKGNLEICSTVIEQNTSGSQGGALYLDQCRLSVRDSEIRGGHAVSGGAVYFNTDVKATFTDCEIVTNSCVDNGGAFALSTNTSVNVTCAGLLFEYNVCNSTGAAIYMLNGTLTVTSNSFVNNRTGGGIAQNGGSLNIHSTTFSNNSTIFEGGAIRKSNGTMTVTECEFDGNSAAGGNGGAIIHQGGPTLINRSTFVNNRCTNNGGGVGATASLLDIVNCTFSGNEADNVGGGVYSTVTGLDIVSCTLTGNIADADNDSFGDGGGIWANTDVFTSNLIAGNIDRGGECPDIGSVSSSQGYNLIGTVGQYNFAANTSGDRYGDPNGVVTPNAGALESSTVIDAQLEALADNGGYGRTHAIAINSPAFGTSTTAGVSLIDQRGQKRLGLPDIGAFELQIPLLVTGPSTVCLGAAFNVHVVTPIPGARYNWSLFNGNVVSGGSSTCAVVKVNSLAGSRVTLTESFAGGQIRTTSLTVNSVLFAAQDHGSVTEGGSIEIDVLDNDFGENLSLLSVDVPSTGSAIVSSTGTVMYTAPTGYSGCVQFNYTMTDNAGCNATGAIIVAVQVGFVNNANLQFVERRKDRSEGVRGLNNVSDVVVSPDGRHAYAAGWLDNSIAMFSRDSAGGKLEYIGRMRHGRNGVTRMRYPAALAFSPDGNNLYVAANRDNSIVVFKRNSTTGKLSFVEFHRHNQDGVSGMKGPRAVTVSPLGDNIYVASFDSDAVAVFVRDANTGRLQFVEEQRNNIGDVRGLNGALDLTVSPDGSGVYTAGHADNSLVHFQRDLTNGRLSYRGRYEDGVDGVDGLAGAASVVVTPDAQFVYVAGKSDNAIASFSRSTSTGTLSFIGRIRDGAPGVKGLARVSDLAVSKDCGYLYAVAETDYALTQFARDCHSGTLTANDKLSDGTEGADGLKQAVAVTLGGDGRHIYTAASGDDAVGVFKWYRLPRGEDRTITRLRGSTVATASFVFNYDADLPVTLQGYSNGSFGNVSVANNNTPDPVTRVITLLYSVVTDDFPDSFTYTLENANGTTTHTVRVLEELTKGDSADESPKPTQQQAQEVIVIRISPNPARDFTDIAFLLSADANVELSIFDLSGVKVGQIELPHLPAGEQHVLWQINKDSSGQLPQGSYIVQLKARDAAGRMISGSSMLRLVR